MKFKSLNAKLAQLKAQLERDRENALSLLCNEQKKRKCLEDFLFYMESSSKKARAASLEEDVVCLEENDEPENNN